MASDEAKWRRAERERPAFAITIVTHHRPPTYAELQHQWGDQDETWGEPAIIQRQLEQALSGQKQRSRHRVTLNDG